MIQMQNVLALVFAGARTARLSILEKKRTNTAIPFGGSYRLIDFSLSNLANSGVNHIGVLTQYRPSSLIDHIDFGKPWDLIGRTREVKVLPPYTSENDNHWYKGTADAIYQNIDYIESLNHDDVLFVSGEDIYKFDYYKLYEHHKRYNADVTIVGKHLDYENLSRFGIIQMGEDNRAFDFAEKPEKPKNNLVFTSIAIFKKNVLIEAVKRDALNPYSHHSFSADVLPTLIKEKIVSVYVNEDPWHYIGDIKEYWEVSMRMLSDNSLIDPEAWDIRTNLDDRKSCYRKPVLIKDNGAVKNSIISKGCEIDGEVISSILFPGVKVAKGAVIKRSIIMHDCVIGEDVFCEMAVLDKDVKVQDEANIGVGQNIANKQEKFYNVGITVIGKNVQIPLGAIIGKNCLIGDNVNQYNFEDNNLPSGSSIFK
ncbi:MAG: glucose-1-phosphate adenylyltransferase [bacterium]|nr:glucose-1-phosphate adenylyltransferase [bacterium]